MDWSITSNVLQALYWTFLFALFVNGYSIGSRTLI